MSRRSSAEEDARNGRGKLAQIVHPLETEVRNGPKNFEASYRDVWRAGASVRWVVLCRCRTFQAAATRQPTHVYAARESKASTEDTTTPHYCVGKIRPEQRVPKVEGSQHQTKCVARPRR